MGPLDAEEDEVAGVDGDDDRRRERGAEARLRAFVEAVLVSCGVREADAATAAKVLVIADVRGIDSHGVARLNAYCSMMRAGTINPRPNIRIVRELSLIHI